MKKSELEAWVLNVIDRVEAGQPNEDARVELKREWPDPKRAARRIAGHANAAGGDLILWIVGVDQSEGVVVVNDLDVASWFSQVKAEFSELAPDLLLDLNVPVKAKTVVALLFETDRAPFIVKNPAFGSAGGGHVELEVPWREGTGIRSATRSDLLRLLSPLQSLPSFEMIDGSLKMRLSESKGGIRMPWAVTLKLYVTPKAVPVVIPYHRCKAVISLDRFGFKVSLPELSIYRAGKVFGIGLSGRIGSRGSITIEESWSEVIINGPGMLKVEAWTYSADLLDVLPTDNARATVEVFPADAEQPCVLSADFRYLHFNDGEKEHEWVLAKSGA